MSLIAEAFRDNPQLHSRVQFAASDPNQSPLLRDISDHVLALQQEIRSLKRKLDDIASSQEPLEKRRKLPLAGSDAASGPGVTSIAASRAAASSWATSRARFSAEDLSFSSPVRKKLRLEVVPAGPGTDGGIRGRNAATGEDEVAIAWSGIDHIVCVSVPEKAQPAFNFVVFPSPSSNGASEPGEPIVWSVPGTGPKGIAFPDGGSVREEETYEGVIIRVIDEELNKVGKAVVLPAADEFASSLVQAHRKGEKAWHVKAWRGSKEGYLYFLGPGILFGFKKPLLFFPFSAINHISYTSVLQRTFNLNIAALMPSAQPSHGQALQDQEFEFAMLDQADFAGIDAYIKRHGLHDASLAESRRAKRFNVNPPNAAPATEAAANGAPADTAAANGAAVEDESELAKAERELQDAEDAEEEDYEVSGGETDGSGSGSDDEEAEGGDEGGDGQEEEEEEEEEVEEEEYEDEL